MNGETPVPPVSNQPESPWQYKSAPQTPVPAPRPELNQPAATPAALPSEEVTWTASEFIDHHKGVGWYAALAAVIIAVDAVIFFVVRDAVSFIAATIMGIFIGIVAGRKPRVMEYKLDAAGLTIGSILHPYSNFKSFAIIDDNGFPSIMLVPLKRFLPAVNVYCDPEDADRITSFLGQYLPMEIRERDGIDRFTNRIRF